MSMSSRSSSITQAQFSGYPYQQDAIRVVAQHNADGQDAQQRRFSVDPTLTSFDILRNLVGRAFELKGFDFAIYYRAVDDYGGEAYLPMVSDWDLSAAFLSASEPDLNLIVEKKNVPLDVDDGCGDYEEEEQWELNKVGHSVPPSSPRFENNLDAKSISSQRSDGSTSGFSSQASISMISRVSSAVSYTNQQYPISFNAKINTAGIFNAMEKLVQKARNLYDDLAVVTSRPPLSDVEFRNYLDSGGTLCKPRELRFACYHGGIEASLRKVVWKHLLNVYPDGLTGNARMEYIRTKSKEYFDLKDAWTPALPQDLTGKPGKTEEPYEGKPMTNQMKEEVKAVSNMVRKDVFRTDRHLKFFAGPDDNPNTNSLFNILTTYSLNHPTIGYCQGMSDLASPLLYTMGDEAQAYICFCALMDRLKPNFSLDGLAMSLKFSHLAEGLAYYDQQFWLYLKSVGADDLLFCYRWLLIELKREFAFEDALKMMEVMWASLPYKPQDVPLFEVRFTLFNANPIPIPVPSLTTSYTTLAKIRRSSTALSAMDIRQRRYSTKKSKGNNTSLDENSLTSLSTSGSSTGVKTHRKPFYSLDESSEMLTSSEILSTSPFDAVPPENSKTIGKPKMIKDLREFWRMSQRPKSFSSISDISQSHTATTLTKSSSAASSTYESLKDAMDAELNGQGQVFLDDEVTTPTEQDNLENSLKPYGGVSSSNGMNKNLMSQSAPLPSMINDKNSFSSGELLSSCESEPNELSATASVVQLRRHVSAGASLPTSPARRQISSMEQHNSSNLDLYNEHNNTPLPVPHLSYMSSNGSDVVIPKNENDKLSENMESEQDSAYSLSQSIDTSVEPEFQTGGTRQPPKMPNPEVLGGGNPFLMFLSLTLLLQHRDHIMKNRMDYNETAMYFDKMIRKHNVSKVLAHARQMYSSYLKQSVNTHA